MKYYLYNVKLQVSDSLDGSYYYIPVSFKSYSILSDKDIRLQAINRTPEKYVSYGWFTYTVEVSYEEEN